MPRPMTKGGPTDQIRQNGGFDLFVTFAMAAAGKPVPVAAYAVTRMLTNIALMFPDREGADAFIDQFAADVKNELDLNWEDREKLIADSVASIHLEGGNG